MTPHLFDSYNPLYIRSAKYRRATPPQYKPEDGGEKQGRKTSNEHETAIANYTCRAAGKKLVGTRARGEALRPGSRARAGCGASRGRRPSTTGRWCAGSALRRRGAARRSLRPTACPTAKKRGAPGDTSGTLVGIPSTQGIPRVSQKTYLLGVPRVCRLRDTQLTLGQLYPRAPWGSRSTTPQGLPKQLRRRPTAQARPGPCALGTQDSDPDLGCALCVAHRPRIAV